jgi:hypothetical protein
VKFDTHRWCAAIVFVATLVIYAMTMADSVSFWDCGEFAAVSYTVGVPHPPGTPLFILLGRIFSLLPLSSDINVRVTYESVVAGAFAILFAYLIIVRLIRHLRGTEVTTLDKLITYGGGIVGSLSLAFSYSMWFNVVESEVYASSQFCTHLVVWLILVWYEKADEPGNERYLLLIAYSIGLSIGIHLLNVLAIPALALVIYFRKRKFEIGSFIALIVLTILSLIAVYPGIVKWLPELAHKFGSWWVPVLVVAAIGGVFWWAVQRKAGMTGLITGSILLVVVGMAGYGVIYIR